MRKNSSILARFYVAAMLCVVISAHGQGTSGDYQRAATIGRDMASKVYRAAVKPHWIDDNHFWYRNDLAGGKREFILVDAAAPSRKPAFDSSKLAVSLTKVLGKPVDADRLPVENISINPQTHAIAVQVGLKTYRVDASYDLTETVSDLGRARAYLSRQGPRVSGSSTDETTLTFVNSTTEEVKLFWLDTEGARHDYGTVAKGAQREMHTFATHVWLAADANGRTIAMFQAGASPEIAEIKPITDLGTPNPIQRRNPTGDSAPGGKWRAYIKDFNLWIAPLPSGDDIQLTHDGNADDRYEDPVYWSPDAAHLLAFKTTPEQAHDIYEVESSPRDQVQPKLHTIHYLKPGDQIAHPKPHLFDVANRKEIPVNDALMSNPWALDEAEWDRDSKRITMVYNQRGHQVMRLIAIDAETGGVTAPIDEESKTFIDYSGKFYLMRLPMTHEAIWMSERDGWNHLYLYDTSAGKVKNQITRGNWVVRGVDRVDPVVRKIWFRASGVVPSQDPYYIQYACVNFDGSGLAWLTAGDGTHTIEYSPNAAYLVDTYSRVDLASVSVLRNASNGSTKVSILKRAMLPH